MSEAASAQRDDRDMMATHGLDRVRLIADAVLYEGYVLFPYHAAATKNRFRWQFGVVVPEPQAALEASESAAVTSQVLLRAPDDARLEVMARFLHPRRRQVEQRRGGGFEPVDRLEVGGELHTTWEEGVEHEHVVGPHPLASLLEGRKHLQIQLDGSQETEGLHEPNGELAGRIVRTTEPVELRLEVTADPADPHHPEVVRLTTVVRNVTAWSDPQAQRAEVVRHGVAGLHLALVASNGSFASAIDPPAWAAGLAATCDNTGTYPVLIGTEGADDLVLSSPIILYDHPEIDQDSPGDAYDATEIHELLTLCTTALSDEEKRSARATDPRAAAVIDDADHLPAELRARLHGVLQPLPPREASTRPERIIRPNGPGDPASALAGTQLNEPAEAHALDDELAAFLGIGEEPIDVVDVDGISVGLGDRVRLEPARRADAQDVFVAGRIGVIGKIVETVDGEAQVGVTLEDDPAAELHQWYGRYLYFHLDEIVPVTTRPRRETT